MGAAAAAAARRRCRHSRRCVVNDPSCPLLFDLQAMGPHLLPDDLLQPTHVVSCGGCASPARLRLPRRFAPLHPSPPRPLPPSLPGDHTVTSLLSTACGPSTTTDPIPAAASPTTPLPPATSPPVS